LAHGWTQRLWNKKGVLLLTATGKPGKTRPPKGNSSKDLSVAKKTKGKEEESRK
jgi:hypothetical protein